METKIMSEFEILKAALSVGFVKFSYYKKDGSYRVAVGTRNADLITKLIGRERVEKSGRVASSNVLVYFDLSRGGFRSFIINNFNHIEFERMTTEQAVIQALSISFISRDCDRDDFECSVYLGEQLIGRDFVVSVIDVLESETNLLSVVTDNEKECDRVAGLIFDKMSKSHKDNIAERIGYNVTAKSRRDDLIAELKALRKRESEILSELLG